MAMEKGLDTGPILYKEEFAIKLQDNAHTLRCKLTQLSAKLMIQAIRHITSIFNGVENIDYKLLNLKDQNILKHHLHVYIVSLCLLDYKRYFYS